ncbi:hypothetical protein CLOM_g226 [Closterium sp. NIES-68]|nr:hypothetical protein CLOM_g226 [Closterium sp. NIES-68]GJP86363.1 hypothetical protein CLOP_g16393 [Closterium sp. NIES-67]
MDKEHPLVFQVRSRQHSAAAAAVAAASGATVPGGGLRLVKGSSAAVTRIHGRIFPEGLYYIAVGLGTPPQTYFLDIDTGSHVSWVTCDAPCVHCAQGPNPWYDPSHASPVDCRSDLCRAAQTGFIRGCSSGSEDQPPGSEAAKAESLEGGGVGLEKGEVGRGRGGGGGESSGKGGEGEEGGSGKMVHAKPRHLQEAVRDMSAGDAGGAGGAAGGGDSNESDFKESDSNEDGINQCDYDIVYADGSSSQGVLVTDRLLFLHPSGTLKAAQFTFGCAYDQEGDLAISPARSDGVLGLGPSNLSLPAQLSRAGVGRNVFGHCLDSAASGGGYFFIGDALLPTAVTWTPRASTSDTRFYHASLLHVSYGSKKLPTSPSKVERDNTGSSPSAYNEDGVESGGAIFDSGSSFTYLTATAFEPLLLMASADAAAAGLQRDTTATVLPHCWKAGKGAPEIRSVADVASHFATLTFAFKSHSIFSSSADLTVAPSTYLFSPGRGTVCLGILNGEESLALGSASRTIIGDIAMRGYLVVYDNENTRIGWTSADCSSKS